MNKLKSGAKNIVLTPVDDLFSSEESRADAKRERVVELPLTELHPFKNHPFKLLDDDKMQDTAQSIREHGVLVPAIVRPREEGGYEIVSGHRRHHASQIAGLDTLPAIIRDLDDDAATIIMVDSNLQRESILPSERAWAYRMKLDAIKRQGARSDLTCVQVDHKLKARDVVAKQAGESAAQVQRFVRLTELIPPLLDMVDEHKIAFNPAVELSYLKPEEQTELLDAMDSEQVTPSLSQAQRLKKFSQEGRLSINVMRAIMSEEKKSELDRITLTGDKSHGYDILAITDHERPRNHQNLADPDFMLITGYECYIRPDKLGRYNPYNKEVHLNLFARDPQNTTMICYNETFCKYLRRDNAFHEITSKAGSERPREYTREYIDEFIRTAKENGYIVAYNHPYWSMEDEADAIAHEGCFSMEICNYGSYVMNGLEYCGALYDKMLYNGKRIFCHGTDDNHNVYPVDHPHNDSFGAFTMIMPEVFTYDGVITALETGEMYASMGPLFKEVSLDGNKLHVECSEVAHIYMYNGGKRPGRIHGVGKNALNTILTTGRCDVEIIHQEHDTLFGHRMPAPSAERLGLLKHRVVEGNHDMGLAMDGDADRLGVIDENGNYLHPNDILVLLYYYLLRYKGWRGPVIRNLATTHRLDAIAQKYGQTCYEVPVGFKHISAGIARHGAILGGESSGGLTVAGHINGKDGVYAASLLVEMVAVTGKRLSELMEEIRQECPDAYMEEQAYKLREDVKKRLQNLLFVEKALPEMKPYEIERVSYMDGCKIYLKGGWVIARFSGTEPLLRVFGEMPEQEEAKRVCACFKTMIDALNKDAES